MKNNGLIFIAALSVFANRLLAIEAIPAPPAISADTYLIMDFDSGRLLAAQNVDTRVHPASLTKIMTGYVIGDELEKKHISLDDEVVISEKAWQMPGSRMFIEVNKQVPVRDLLNGVIIQSGNDSSVALAEHISGDESVFAQVMNRHAARLGLKDTHYVNATGLPDPEHYTTAHDLAVLTTALIRDHPEIYAIHSHQEFTFNGIKQPNRNRLLWLDGSVDGVKTGHTEEAGYCLVVSALRDGMRLITVVTGTESDNARTRATQALLNYGFRFYETRKLFEANKTLTSTKIWKAESATIDLGLKRDLYVTIGRGQFENLNKVFELPDRIVAPVTEGSEQGRLKLMLADKEIFTTPLYAIHSVQQGGLIRRLRDDIQLLFE
ncbi:MAG: D-alanyl-D-alanine carboxypeptidase family protein [Gammaproteobacteria bacterium]